jgi:hypothetical protein
MLEYMFIHLHGKSTERRGGRVWVKVSKQVAERGIVSKWLQTATGRKQPAISKNREGV